MATAATAAAASSVGGKMGRPFLTLSFSGAGHLLPYHLGVASSLLRRNTFQRTADDWRRRPQASPKVTAFGSTSKKEQQMPPIRAVSGSSSGAIAATVFVRLPHRMDEFTDRFLTDGGRAMHHLTEMLHDEERRGGPSSMSSSSSSTTTLAAEVIAQKNVNCAIGGSAAGRSPSLHIAATRCSDGKLRLFDFPPVSSTFRTISSSWTTDDVLTAVRASCRIPRTFHPADILEPWWGREGDDVATYPDEDGVDIDGASYVDGGIAAPAPPTPYDGWDGAVRVVVSPISGSSVAVVPAAAVEFEPSGTATARRISPADDSWNLLPFELRCRGGFRVRPSLQNLRALRVSLAGAASSEELRGWYERGIEDGEGMAASGWSL